MKRFIFGFQRRVWWPKWTPASRSSRMVTTDKTAPFFGLCGASTGGARAEPGLAPGTPARPDRRVVEREPGGMEELAREPQIARSAVNRIAGDGQADRGQVDTDLVRAPGLEGDIEQRVLAHRLQDLEVRDGGARKRRVQGAAGGGAAGGAGGGGGAGRGGG